MVTQANIGQLNDCQFVFIAVDHGPSRGLIARHLAALRIPFIDVGIGLEKNTDLVQLHGRARVTLVTPSTTHLVDSLPTADDSDEAVYGNMPPFGLGKVGRLVPVSESSSARERIKAMAAGTTGDAPS